MNTSSADVVGQVAALENRALVLKRRGKRFGLFAGLALLLAGVLGVATDKVSPDAYAKVDVPESVLSLLPSAATQAELPFSSASADITGFLASPIVFLFAIGGIVFVGLVYVFGGSESFVVRKILMLGVVLGSLIAASSVTSYFSADGSASPTARTLFLEAVEKGDFPRVRVKLVAAPGGDGSPGATYVLAQVALSRSHSKLTPLPPYEREVVSRAADAMALSPVQLGFTPEGRAAYTIEKAAYGAPRSRAAKAYYDDAWRKMSWLRAIAGGSSVIGALLAGLAAGLLALALALVSRVRRIRTLLAVEPGAKA
ncbi:hypothetical protein LMG31886_45050 (plasmid) [Xanthomonas hydrangeae]|uniref:TrbC/VirB2 family protein n=1 Tax=Xanthomonas hydrangeae TaxID=2775159 RepID=UPI001966262B|nr:hypothetical protein LMG31884_48000 [Xanthomonas hydrangeae]CAD7741759.1 hypothetical protein LMG31884_48000 [Xanthomonas hydrangeae]CAD7748072.1 hypothetical protein LMG31887_46980 [Xanthomonas hydrangeae]CAD7748073.1 hypothetical protein LMG31887_46980 [Xanthomonas hydrangeae]CAD7748304.1 hypothetical protein LMG31886_45050 [Xanthomonas hydrangeae]